MSFARLPPYVAGRYQKKIPRTSPVRGELWRKAAAKTGSLPAQAAARHARVRARDTHAESAHESELGTPRRSWDTHTIRKGDLGTPTRSEIAHQNPSEGHPRATGAHTILGQTILGHPPILGRSWDTHKSILRSWDTHDPKLRIRIRVRDTHAQQARVKTALKGLNRVAQGNALGLPPQ